MAGVKLTKHDTFLRRADFMQLVYACCSPARPGLTDATDLRVPPPAIWKPEPLWTGKQVQQVPWNNSTEHEEASLACRAQLDPFQLHPGDDTCKQK